MLKYNDSQWRKLKCFVVSYKNPFLVRFCCKIQNIKQLPLILFADDTNVFFLQQLQHDSSFQKLELHTIALSRATLRQLFLELHYEISFHSNDSSFQSQSRYDSSFQSYIKIVPLSQHYDSSFWSWITIAPSRATLHLFLELHYDSSFYSYLMITLSFLSYIIALSRAPLCLAHHQARS